MNETQLVILEAAAKIPLQWEDQKTSNRAD
jgi:hypothetical protein